MGSRKTKISISIDTEILNRVRAQNPGATSSRAIEILLRQALERIDLAERVRTLEIICRATIMMLADYIAEGDLRESERIKNAYAQRAMMLVEKMKKEE